MTMVYKFKDTASMPNVDPQAAGERLEELRVHNNGLLTPRAIIEEARPESSPLHNAFEWDDTVAAQKHREWQARYLMGALVAIVPQTETDKPVRAFVNVHREKQQGYTSVAHAMSDAELRAQILAQAMREAIAWKERYREYEELAEIFAAIDRSEGIGSEK